MTHVPAEPAFSFDPIRGDAARATILVRARRSARRAAALALGGGALTLALDALGLVRADALLILAGAWLAALALGAGAYALTRATAVADPAQVALLGPGSSSERLSVALPLAAVALVAPLSLHGLVSLLLGCGPSLRSFDDWVGASLLIVGHAHVALALRAARDGSALAADRPASGVRAVLFTTLVACVPGLILYAVPPILVFVTGAAFVPPLYAAARRWLRDERALLAA